MINYKEIIANLLGDADVCSDINIVMDHNYLDVFNESKLDFSNPSNLRYFVAVFELDCDYCYGSFLSKEDLIKSINNQTTGVEYAYFDLVENKRCFVETTDIKITY